MASSSSIKTLTENDLVFSFKRYFINNLDSYHGEYILKELVKIIDEKNQASTKLSQTILGGEDAQAASLPPPGGEPLYEVIGTVSDPKIKSIDNVSRIVPKNECVPVMLTCGTVILDISYDREELRVATDYISVLKALLEKQTPGALSANDDDETAAAGADESKKRFLILISTVMTWAATKPLDPENAEMPFIESDFRKRKAHPNYKMHKDIENEVIGIARKYRTLIGALVIAAGLTYGGREDVLFYWFQKAWECEPVLPILGRGINAIPLINVVDLAKIVYNLLLDFPKKLYILAVEQNITKQREIVKSLGRSIGSGMFKCIPSEDAFLIPEIDQRIFDLVTLNLNMEPTFIIEKMGLQWTSELPFSENVWHLMKQFTKERGLKAFKILIYGPPIVGKTTLAKRIAQQYGLLYVSPDTVAQDLLESLAARIIHMETPETALLPVPTGEEEDIAVIDDEDAGDDEGALNLLRQQYSLLQATRTFTEEEITGHLRQRLLSHEAMNRGWVLDAYPTTLTQCGTLFEKGDQQDSESEAGEQPEPFDEDVDLFSNVLKKLLPDIVVSLDATDDFICEKAMRMPEGDARFEEETILRRLNEFRNGDTRDNSPLNFFDELDIHPLVVPVNVHEDYEMEQTYHNVALRMGRPCRYGKLMKLIEAAEKKEKQLRSMEKAQAAAALEKMKRKLQEEREEKMEYWTELYALLREEEEAALAAAGEPMRNYLVQNIFPTLTPALLETAKLRPVDPIDFLGEHIFKKNPSAKKLEPELRLILEKLLQKGQTPTVLKASRSLGEKVVRRRGTSATLDELKAEELFKLNPTGKMLEPGYNLQAEKLLGKIKILDEAILDLDIKIDPLYDTTQEDSLFPPSEAGPKPRQFMGAL